MIRAMIVDDSPLVRKIASDILASDPGIEVAATAPNAEIALGKLQRNPPDVITMDIEMPGMSGIDAIRKIMAVRPTPIIVLSAHAEKGAEMTMLALEAGAVDFVLKPASSLSGGIEAVRKQLVESVKNAAGVRLSPNFGAMDGKEAVLSKPRSDVGRPTLAARRNTQVEIVSIGTSTGGPVALKTVLSALPYDFPVPVVVVQHMPPVFTGAFATRLDSLCEVSVKEAEQGDELVPGRVLIAPGDFHMTVLRQLSRATVELNQREQVSGHRPSVDVLMHSVSLEYGDRAVGVIMTGMGKDGADGIRDMHRRGARIIAQDKDSSVIYGMNGEVVRNGDADEILSVDRIGGRLAALARSNGY